MDETSYMELALTLAKSMKGQTGTNPLVGAVAVNAGRIVGTGAHMRQGEAHAEVHALNMAGSHAKGCTLYVTLEPCSHHGRTPPCVERIIREQVKRVVIAALDPNPLVAGGGVQRLREAGIETEVGLMEAEAVQMNEVFHKFITRQMPFITLKAAMTLDGKIATVTGDSRWISNEASRAEVHCLRHQHDAVLVGIGTVEKDDPELTTRMKVEGLQPVRIVVDSTLRLPARAKVVQDKKAPTLVLTTAGGSAEKRRLLEAEGVEVIAVNDAPPVDLQKAMEMLARRGISSILVEGGAALAGAMLQERLVDKLILYIAPKIVGGETAPPVGKMAGVPLISQAVTFRQISYQQVGEDMRFTGYPVYDSQQV
ncbi:bifunctional diaminohydroxyphosphoribosylaminopyrimidine deaminase/5-amino-6-(5-phosphoribosylamino)uracil reductase RibD [Brevibacillus massiliensis]|uniref:bifunctional diaminohydroxyphosphoribosylaminopyrimidine deaminase/5-amino-6-(5-phosphoribosylamino)uracil reductase RibD n=2 Tax=Brevibacillus massiliensis TaxID=1118054 RepID=UPI0002F2161C|nr:bifunctional diaminohydroxyphosphoribosylaminopyrimidine deaminase/5-amino-6-(5-phosphoribosylamino)uracil reductase RibD [Brevibacillus massiliensis]